MSSFSQAFAEGRLIADWNVKHGSIFRRVDAALTDLICSLDAVGDAVTEEQMSQIRESGLRLLETANEGLSGPLPGVPRVDGPRSESLRLFSRAGALIASASLDDSSGTLIRAARLLNRGQAAQAEATRATQSILNAVK